jgi:YbbR domain-containing protein
LDVTASEDKNKTDINSSNVSSSLYLNTLVGITNNTGSAYTKGSKANLTVKIPTDADYDSNHYMSVGYSVSSGYKFIPTSVSIKAQPVSTDKTVKLVLTDGVNSVERSKVV